MVPEVQTTPAMSDTDHSAHGATATAGHDNHAHDDHGTGHGDHGHAADTLGPIDWTMWGVGVLGVIVAAIVVVGFVIATKFTLS